MRARLGELIVGGVQGPTLDDAARRLIEQRRVGGLILFARNCPSPDAAAELIGRAKDINPALWIGVDQEGGRVMRLNRPPYLLPSARALAAMFRPEEISRIAAGLARELNKLGFNLNFAPVLDVASNPDNAVIGDRAFGDAPQAAIPAALAFAQGLREGGVVPCGKHFPGHGDTLADSHRELPRVTHPLARLRRVELKPFAEAAKQRIEMLMTAHVLYEQLDPDDPATLSARIVPDLLRRELRYDGVVVSDDLEMGALKGRYPVETLAAKLNRATVDLWLVCHTAALAEQLHAALTDLVERDADAAARAADSLRRLDALKAAFGVARAGAA